MRSLPRVPWQVTGNHWLTLPCIHPADASIHLIGSVSAAQRAAIEFAGGANYLDGGAEPLVRILVEMNGERILPGGGGLAWERESGWMPTFSARTGPLTIRGTVCAPHGSGADVAGAVVAIQVDNRGASDVELRLGVGGRLGLRQARIRSPRDLGGDHAVTAADDGAVVLDGTTVSSSMAIAVGGESACARTIDEHDWLLSCRATVPAGGSVERVFFLAAGAERDSAVATLGVMRRRGGTALIATTRATLRSMEPATGNQQADRLIARHAFFAYFCGLARALDASHWFVARSRIPWNPHGLTIRDWDALCWILPAVQLLDPSLSREILLRVCELHGHAPGEGVHYVDGALFESGFSLEGACSYALAVDGYIVATSDDRIVEEPVLADSLYAAWDDIESRKHTQYPLYSTEVNPDGGLPVEPYTSHGNAVAALALEILSRTLDEKTAERVQDPAAVRAALLRHLSDGSAKPALRASTDLAGKSSAADYPEASLYWLPFFDLLSRDDSVYRRSVKPLEARAPRELAVRCARLLGPGSREAMEWLRRAPLDGGLAAQTVDEEGRAVAGGGDAALSGLIAYMVWYAVSALGT